jgi:hypothetical protein
VSPADQARGGLDREPSTRDDEILQRLRAVDVDDTTPRQALELIAELKKLADG